MYYISSHSRLWIFAIGGAGVARSPQWSSNVLPRYRGWGASKISDIYTHPPPGRTYHQNIPSTWGAFQKQLGGCGVSSLVLRLHNLFLPVLLVFVFVCVFTIVTRGRLRHLPDAGLQSFGLLISSGREQNTRTRPTSGLIEKSPTRKMSQGDLNKQKCHASCNL